MLTKKQASGGSSASYGASGRYGSSGTYSGGYSRTNGSAYSGPNAAEFARARSFINQNNLNAARTVLDGANVVHNAEWNYLYGVISCGRGRMKRRTPASAALTKWTRTIRLPKRLCLLEQFRPSLYARQRRRFRRFALLRYLLGAHVPELLLRRRLHVTASIRNGISPRPRRFAWPGACFYAGSRDRRIRQNHVFGDSRAMGSGLVVYYR